MLGGAEASPPGERAQALNALGVNPLSILMDIVEDRYGCKSTMLVGQVPMSSGHEVIGNTTITDARMDRYNHRANSIEQGDETLRKKSPADRNHYQ